MKPLEVEHLLVGGGLLGLATADHLLRRGARGVLLIERAGSPNGGRPGEVGALVRQGGWEHDELEARGRLLLCSGEEYLDVDYLRDGDGYRRVGSLRIPAEDALPFESERLSIPQLAERYPGLVEGPGSVAGHGFGADSEAADPDAAEVDAGARFFAEDGAIDTLPLIAAFHARVRSQGARILFDAELGTLDEESDQVRFTAGGRTGRAERVHLTAGAENLRFLPQLGCRHAWRLEQVHTFLVQAPWGQSPGAQSSRAQSSRAQSPGEQSLGAQGPVLWLPSRRVVLLPLGEGSWEIEIAVDGEIGVEPTVDWTLLEELRKTEGARFPWLAASEVRRARVLPRLAFDAEDPILVSRGGRIAAAGAFGPHGLGLFPAVAERLADRGLSPLEEAGGLLEEGF